MNSNDSDGARLPSDEPRRVARLHALKILDSAAEPIYEHITRTAAEICGLPIALLSLVDESRQWFKSNYGLDGVTETPRGVAFCAHAILGDDLMEVEDARSDPRFNDNPLVIGAPHIRSYAGMPIAMPTGERLGTLCVIGRQPHRLTPEQREALRGLGRIAAAAVLAHEQRLSLTTDLSRREAAYRTVVEGQIELISLATDDLVLTFVNEAYAQFFGLTAAEMIGRSLLDFVSTGDRDAVAGHLRNLVAERSRKESSNRMTTPGRPARWVSWKNRWLEPDEGQPGLIHSVGLDVTRQREAERALQAAQERTRRLYESTPAMLHSIDTAGRLVSVSDLWLKRLGYERHEVIGRPSSDFLTPESRERARREVLPKFFAQGSCDNVAYQMLRKDGTVIDVLLSATLDHDEDGRPGRSLAVLEDVSEKNATAATLRETTHTLQLVMDNLPARVSYWTTENRNIFANKAFLLGFGQTQESVAGRLAVDVMGAEWWSHIEPTVREALSGVERHMEVETRAPGGAAIVTDLRFKPDVVGDRVGGVFVIALDVSARRSAERALAEREFRFRLLVESVRDYAIYMLDPHGIITTWNSGAQRIKGYRADEVLERHFELFFTEDDRKIGKPRRLLEQAAHDGRVEVEDWRRRKDGTIFLASIVLSAIRDHTGLLVGFAKVARDLTEQQRQRDILTRVAEVAPSAMLMTNAGGKIVMVNARAEVLFGYARHELLGSSVERLVPLRYRNRHPALRLNFQHGDAARAMGPGRDLWALKKSGTEFPVEIGLSSIDTADGPITLSAIHDLTEHRRQQAATQAALAEKETLLREVYHRVKNNLQVIQSLLNLRRRSLQDGPARAALEESVLRIRAMALVHEKLYQSGNLAAVSLPAYVSDLALQVADANGADRHTVHVDIQVEEFDTGLDNAIPFGLLLTELLSNAFKHAFAEGEPGTVKITLKRDLGSTLLEVADDGVGLQGDPLSEPASSMGLQLAAILARQLGGELSARTEGGAVFSARLARL